jgi:hypothetical protein
LSRDFATRGECVFATLERERRIGFLKPTQSFSKSCQASPSLSQITPRKKLGFPWIGLSGMSLFNGLR